MVAAGSPRATANKQPRAPVPLPVQMWLNCLCPSTLGNTPAQARLGTPLLLLQKTPCTQASTALCSFLLLCSLLAINCAHTFFYLGEVRRRADSEADAGADGTCMCAPSLVFRWPGWWSATIRVLVLQGPANAGASAGAAHTYLHPSLHVMDAPQVATGTIYDRGLAFLVGCIVVVAADLSLVLLLGVTPSAEGKVGGVSLEGAAHVMCDPQVADAMYDLGLGCSPAAPAHMCPQAPRSLQPPPPLALAQAAGGR